VKQYPKTEYHNKGIYDSRVIAWDKLDGSNLRFEWSHKRGFYKFGTRNVMIDVNDDNFGKAIPLFLDKYGDSIPRVFVDRYRKVENFVVFAEYLGENSFAGYHDPTDIMDIVLFDVNQYKRGFVPTWEFLNNFGHLHIPTVIYDGLYTPEFVQDVRKNKFGLREGVMCKGVTKNKANKEETWQVKVKTNDWLQKVRNKLGDKGLLDELNGDRNLLKELL